MNEKDLGKALLGSEDPIDLATLTARVLRRDRRRMWFLGIVCVIAWMMVVMLPWATILPMMAKVAHQTAIDRGTAARPADQQQEQSVQMLEVLKQGTIVTFFDSIASMLVASICTVALIILSRRATLRQLNARLAEISSQIKLLARDSR